MLSVFNVVYEVVPGTLHTQCSGKCIMSCVGTIYQLWLVWYHVQRYLHMFELITINKCRVVRSLCYRMAGTTSLARSQPRTGNLRNVLAALYSWKVRCMASERFISAEPMNLSRVSFLRIPISPKRSVP